ncbi:MAG TPA: VUT family protein [Rubrivivax sp.]|nr:VUT family protein [Rubrivivax sp.]
MPRTSTPATWQALRMPILAMAAVIVLSNVLVQHPINEWLTWGAFSFPVVFLVTDLTNRTLGPAAARRVAWVGFALAVAVSLLLAPWRIALASGCAFILAQILDISLFNRLRRLSWWKAPLLGSLAASVLDTAVFFFLAFAGTALDWTLLAAGDLAVKAAMAALLLAPYRLLLPRLQVWATPS